MAWVAEELFDSYSDGDLNGNNGGSGFSAAWSGGTNYDVQGTTVYQGAKAVTGVNANQNISRPLTTAVSSGVVYVAMRYSAGTGDAQFDFRTSGNTTNAFRISMRDVSGSKNILTLAAVETTLLTGFDTSVFYVFEVTINGDNTFNIRFHNGTSWSSTTSNLAYANNGNIDGVQLNSGGAQTVFYDYISPTNPISSTSIKTVNGLAYASVKTVNGLAVASVKTIKGLA